MKKLLSSTGNGKKTTYYAVACSKCGFVVNEYTSSTRRQTNRLRIEDEDVAIKDHDVKVHGPDGICYETTNIQIQVFPRTNPEGTSS